jgi:serine/threonine protein kinase
MKECPKCELCFEDDVSFCASDGSTLKPSLPGGLLLAHRYQLERRLGRGAMGQVYLASDTRFKARRVAVKTVRPDLLSSEHMQEGEALARFAREAQAAASIQHPNTVSVTDFGETDEGVFFLVMEYVEGETLHRLLRREGTLPVKRAVRLLRQIADGVQAAHETGILHRDLKPANIFVMHKGVGSDGFIKVGDFGLAKIVNTAVTDTSSVNGPASRGIVGTPEFMSPEQMQPEMQLDARSDLYALATIAYLMLGGKTPFTGDLMQLVTQKIMQQPRPISTLRTDIPAVVDRVIMHALATDPSKRHASVADWIEDLENAAEGTTDHGSAGASRLVILAPPRAEVYVDDERKGSVGSAGRLVLVGIVPGNHILRVSLAGEKDDERVVEIRAGSDEQVVQANLRAASSSGGGNASHSGGQGAAGTSIMPGIVECTNCRSKFAEGVRFCGRCGGVRFVIVQQGDMPEGQPCARCATVLPPNSRFCGRCGLSMSQAHYVAPVISAQVSPAFPTAAQAQQAERLCRRCGEAYAPHIKFCGRCGLTLR